MSHLLGLHFSASRSNSHASLTLAQEESLGHMGPRRKPRAHGPKTTSDQTGVLRLSGMAIIDTRIFPRVIQDSDTKTLRNLELLCCLQLDNTTPMILGSSYATRLSSRSKCYNALISMRGVMSSSGYLCMAIPTIKRRDLDSYKEIITCKSWSYVDSKYSHSQWQFKRV